MVQIAALEFHLFYLQNFFNTKTTRCGKWSARVDTECKSLLKSKHPQMKDTSEAKWLLSSIQSRAKSPLQWVQCLLNREIAYKIPSQNDEWLGSNLIKINQWCTSIPLGGFVRFGKILMCVEFLWNPLHHIWSPSLI